MTGFTFLRRTVLLVAAALTLSQSLKAQSLGQGGTAYHTVGLQANGLVYAWGHGNQGQLGNDEYSNSSTLVQVVKGAYSGTTYLGDDTDNKITMLGSGRHFSIALATDGTVYTWGYGNWGTLGHNSTSSSDTPVKVVNGDYSGTSYLGDNSSNKITAVAQGGQHSIALATDGTVYTWGSSDYGQLGNNSSGDDSDESTPVKVLMGSYSGTTYLGDDSDNKIIAVAAGESHSIALAADGTVFAWGYGSNGQMGNSNSSENNAVPVKVVSGAYSGTTYLGDDSDNKITAISAGSHSVALAADGTVYAWGRNNEGQLGDNSTTNRSTPVKVLDGAYSGTTYLGDDSDNKITAISAGSH
ncbi:MAG: hypothetical protein QGH61_02925, partial [Candidatus Marinimicrobia bacterium]|nr:hypothetical protein [Candidatus Neomarinimicrobiota bacterium]